MKKIVYIRGMHCQSCEMLVKSELEDIGVKAEIDYISGKTLVEFDDSKTSLEKIKETIKKAGYSV